MKTKPCAEIRREENGLYLSCQSIKITKNSGFDIKRCREDPPEEPSRCEVKTMGTSSVSFPEVACTEANNIEHFQVRGSLSSTSLVEKTASLSSHCPTTLETIFSPVCESDGHCQPTVSNRTVTNDDVPEPAADETDEDAELDHLIASYPTSNSITVDLEETYLTLPHLEESLETGNIYDGDIVDEAVVNSDDASLYQAIQQMKRPDDTGLMGSYSSDLDAKDLDDFDPQLFIQNLPDLSDIKMEIWSTLLPKESPTKKSVTLVLDLDETLVHSILDHCEDADFTFPVFFNMEEHIVYVRQRPYLHVFLERVAEMFEVFVFTASQSIYAEQLLDIIDPDQRLISRRFYRESCIFSDGSYVKDLSILGQDLSKVVIIDNSPPVFRLQVNNGIPIQSWFDDQSDSALISLLPFLEILAEANDVRPIIASRFNLNS